MQQQEGWTHVVRKSCVSCCWYTPTLIWSDGTNVSKCTHPSWHTQDNQQATRNPSQGKIIGTIDETPYWCPVGQAKTKPPVLTQGV